MSKEELIAFLKESLVITIDTKPHDDFYRGVTGYDIVVKIKLGEEVIAEGTDSIDIK
jgi:hypothetical protein